MKVQIYIMPSIKEIFIWGWKFITKFVYKEDATQSG